MAYYCPFRYGVVHRKKTAKYPTRIRKLKNLIVIPADAKPANQISLKKEEVFGSNKNVTIGRMGHIAVDDSGRVFIADKQQHRVDVFEPNGKFLAHFGRRGRGPGEFIAISGVQIQSKKIFVSDPALKRYDIFDLNTFNLINTINLVSNLHDITALKGAFPGGYFPESNDAFIAWFNKDTLTANQDWGKAQTMDYYYRLNKKGNIISQRILEVEGQLNVMVPWKGGVTDRQGNYASIPRIAVHPKFYGKSFTAFSNNNHIYQAWSENFLVKEYNPKGEYERAFYNPFQGVRLTKESAVKAGVPKHILRGWNSMYRSKTWPVIADMKIDKQNQLWVASIVKNMKVYEWWMLDKKGNLLARFTWPRDKSIQVIKNGYLYTKEKNKSGLNEIVRYKLILQPLG